MDEMGEEVVVYKCMFPVIHFNLSVLSVNTCCITYTGLYVSVCNNNTVWYMYCQVV